jgi:hypothetical protein
MTRGGPTTSGGAGGAWRSLTLGRLSGLRSRQWSAYETAPGLERGHVIALPWPCRFGWRWIISILERIRDQAPATARLVSLNRARRRAYNDIDSVNISGGLVVLQFEMKVKLKTLGWRGCQPQPPQATIVEFGNPQTGPNGETKAGPLRPLSTIGHLLGLTCSAWLRFAHPQLRLKQQQLRSKDGNRKCSCRDSDVE